MTENIAVVDAPTVIIGILKIIHKIFKNIICNKGVINAIVVKNAANSFSRKDLDKLTEFVKIYKAKALSYLKYNDSELSGSIFKVMNEEEKLEIAED